MIRALRRLVYRISAWLPDISFVPPHKQVLGGLLVAALLHLLAFAVMVILSWILPAPVEAVAPAKPKLLEVEVQLVPPPPEPKRLKAAPEFVPVIDSEGLAKSSQAPKRTEFQSSQDMVAASERAGKGLEPLPSQNGAVLDFTQFKNQTAKLGKPEDAPTDLAEKAPPQPAPPANYKVKPLPKEYLEALAKIEASHQAAQELPPTPSPTEPIVPAEDRKKAADGIALGPKPSTPAPQPRATPKATAVTQLAALATPRPASASAPGFQAEQHQTRVEGSITNQGASSVDAVKTPLGVYRKRLFAQIQSRWQFYTKERMDMIAVGTVRLRFFVTKDGRVQGIEILENGSNQNFANVCEQSVREAEIPAPPSELELMKDGRLELFLSFTLF